MSSRITPGARTHEPVAPQIPPGAALTTQVAALQQLLQALLASTARTCLERSALGAEPPCTRATGPATAEGAGPRAGVGASGLPSTGTQTGAGALSGLIPTERAPFVASPGTTLSANVGGRAPGDASLVMPRAGASATSAPDWTASGPLKTGPSPARAPSDHEVVSILGRHEGRFKNADLATLRKMASDADTPPDLKRGLDELLRNPGLQKTLMGDGRLQAKDINSAQKNMPGQQAYAEAKAREYTQNYVPSDAAPGQAGPRAMTSNDAMRELFKYSDELPKRVSREALKDIANGTANAGRCPPQLQAAAQFYVDHPEAWKRDVGCGPDRSIRKDKLLNRTDDKIQLTQAEHDTLRTLSTHRDQFFGGKSLTPDKLKKLAQDEKADPEVRAAAQSLLSNKMLFAMLDNGKHQHGGNPIHPANDKKIGEGDLNAWLRRMNKTVAPAQASPATAPQHLSLSAARDMLEGQYNQPDFKHKKGGGLADFGAGLLKGFSFVAGLASGALGAVANLRIPGLSWLAGAGAMGLSMAQGAAKVGATAIEGGDVKQEGINAGIGSAATLVGLIGGKGASKAAKEGLEKVAKEGAKEGAEKAAQQGRHGLQNWAQKSVNSQTDVTRGEVALAAAKGAGQQAALGALSAEGMKMIEGGAGSGEAQPGSVPARQQVDAQVQQIAAQYGVMG